MANMLKQYTADHRYLLHLAGRQLGLTAPVAVQLEEYHYPLLQASRKGELMPVDGMLVRDWDTSWRPGNPRLQWGMRCYEIAGIRFVYVSAVPAKGANPAGLSFVVVDRKDYLRLYRVALRCCRVTRHGLPPVLPADQLEVLRQNTLGYLDRTNLRRIREYGGRPRRGLLLTGPPGNGKTMACRWLWQECQLRNWDFRLVTPSTYQQARQNACNPEAAVQRLFSVYPRGIIFFDDMDFALRDRENVKETDDQAIFLTALDGITLHEGVVFVFTTNCGLDLIDRAFKRPGRIDVVLHFQAPDAGLRRQLMDRWHEDIRGGIDPDAAVASTEGYSFAEIEELKNLLILRYIDAGAWDWHWAMEQFGANRSELAARRQVGFVQPEAVCNGSPNGD